MNIRFRILRRSGIARNYVRWLEKVHLPYFPEFNLESVFSAFLRNLVKADVSTKASGIAFNLFFSLFPGLLFLFTLLPFLPIKDLDKEVLSLLQSILPWDAYSTIESTLKDILKNKRGGLLSLGFVTTIYFASSSVYSFTETFSPTSKRAFWKRRGQAILLTIALGILFIITLVIIILGGVSINWLLIKLPFFRENWIQTVLFVVKWLLILILVFTSLCTLYYFGDDKRLKGLKYVIPGAILGTVFTMITSLGFAFYVNNFSNYNKAYGSLGALVAMMLWINYNCLIILAGHEFIKAIRSNKNIHEKWSKGSSASKRNKNYRIFK